VSPLIPHCVTLSDQPVLVPYSVDTIPSFVLSLILSDLYLISVGL